jgi:hypothetical protein
MAREISFALPLLLPSLNTALRQHWAERERAQKALNLEVLAAIGGSRYIPRPPFARARVTVVRISTGALDPDGAAGSTKSLLDVLKLHDDKRNPLGLSVIQGDEPNRLELIVRQQHAETHAAQQTLVRVEELSGEVVRPIVGKSGKPKAAMSPLQITAMKRKRRQPAAIQAPEPPEDLTDPDWVAKWLDAKTAVLRGG